MLLEKYKVESKAENFALFIVRDNGEQKKLRDDDYPLVTRVVLGPHEDIARIFLMDGQQTPEIRYVSSKEAKFQPLLETITYKVIFLGYDSGHNHELLLLNYYAFFCHSTKQQRSGSVFESLNTRM